MNSISSRSCVLGIDVGTSGVRAIAIDSEGCELAVFRTPYTEVNDNESPDNAYRSTDLWWQALRRSVKSVTEQLQNHKVVALSVDGTSGSVLPINRDGEPIAQPLMYNDTVDDRSILSSVSRVMPQHSAAGGATSALAKAIKFAQLQPYAVVHQADWIIGNLCGNFRHSDANNALKTGFDPLSMQWPDWIKGIADTMPLLPEVAVPGDILNEVSADVASDLGLTTPVKIVAGTTDGCAAFLATGACETGDAVTSLGSTLTLKLLSDKPVFAPQYGVYSHRIADVWLAGGASNTGGAVLAHFFSDDDLQRLCADMDTSHDTGLDYYPLLKPGERFPVNDPHLEPKVKPRPDSDQEYLQGILEGIASIEKAGYTELTGAGGSAVKTIRSVGGGASNSAFSEIRQRILSSEILSIEFKQPLSEEAAYGVATLAKKAADRLNLW